MADFILGVDLGQARDYSAIVVLEQTKHDTGKRNRRVIHQSASYYMGQWSNPPVRVELDPIYEHSYAARHLERLPIGTSYPKQVARLRELTTRLKEEGTVSAWGSTRRGWAARWWTCSGKPSCAPSP